MKTHALRKYCSNIGIREGEMAKQLNVSGTFISLVLNFKRRPSPELAAFIEKTTHGKVKFRDLLLPDEPIKRTVAANSQKEP